MRNYNKKKKIQRI